MQALDQFVHPYAKLPWLPLLINCIWVGWGTTISAILKEGGPDVKTIILGIFNTMVNSFSLVFTIYCTWFGFFILPLIPALLAFCVWLCNYSLGIYIGYKGMKACS